MDTIVYTTISNPGGMDGMSSDKGGNVTGAYLSKEEALKSPNKPWETVNPIVVDLEEVAGKAFAKLNPVEKLAIHKHFESKKTHIRSSEWR